MRLKLDIEIPNWTKWLVGGIAIGVVIGAGAVWAASPQKVTEFADQEILSAEKLNANLGNL